MTLDPVQRGARENQIEPLNEREVTDVHLDECEIALRFQVRGFDHASRGVDSQNRALRETVREAARECAVSASDVEHVLRAAEVEAVDEARAPLPLVHRALFIRPAIKLMVVSWHVVS